MHGKLLMATITTLLLPGCSTRAWYASVQMAAKHACQQPSSERERCESRLNRQDFETYQKHRDTE